MIIPAFVGSKWMAIAAPLANHLWQSTLFVALAGVLALALRKNSAQVRYWIWLVASLKFLLPFSLLVAMGSFLGWSNNIAGSRTGLSLVIEEIGQPFTPPTIHSAVSAGAVGYAKTLLPVLGLTLWFTGCVALLSFWHLRWRRLMAIVRKTQPVTGGRESEVLRRLLSDSRINKPVKLLISESALEPGIAGIFRPAILLPAGIADRLTDAQLKAIIGHELCHLRRNDNLAAALHMLVEAVFWFHPLVWWMGARLVDERERACDEQVLRQGSEPQVYAEAILRVCKFYFEPPLVCVAGISGSNLKKRIEEIMLHHTPHQLRIAQKLLLAVLSAAVVVAPIVFGFLNPARGRAQSLSASAPALSFESAMIKVNKTGEAMPPFKIVSNPPGHALGFRFATDGFKATNATLHQLLRVAYGYNDPQIAGGPDWFDSAKYDLSATLGSSGLSEMKQLTDDQQRQMIREMLQVFLVDRFKMKLHRETRDVPVYVLTLAKTGSKLQPAKAGDHYDHGLMRADGKVQGPGLWSPQWQQLVGQGVPISDLARQLSQKLGRPVLDQTGLSGNYDFNLQWASASLLAAVPEQLGLELNEQTAPVEMLIVDHAEPLSGSN
jgi:uncharacterized protein (TIGR03435 family)